MAEDKKVIIELDIKTDKALADTIALKEAVIKLTEEAKSLKETEGETSAAYVKKQAELKATQKELNQTQNVLVGLTKAEEDQTVTVQKLIARNAELRLERDRTNINTKEGQDRIKAINAEMDKNTQTIRDNADAQKKQTMNIGNYASALDNLGVPQAGAVNGMWNMVKAALAFVATPIGAIIAAVVAAMYLLYEIFKNFEPVVNKVQQAIAAVVAVFSVLKDAALSLFTGQKSLTESFNGLGDSMAKAANDAIALKKAEQDLEDAQIRLIESNAKSKRQIDELILQSKDRTKTEEERIALIDKALKIEEEQYNKKKEIADGEYEQALQKIAISNRLTDEQVADIRERGAIALQELQDSKNILDEEIKAFAEASAKKEEVLGESIAIREKAINRQNVLLDKAEEAEKKRFEDAKAAREKAEADRLKAEEKAKAEREKREKEELERQKKLVDEKLLLLDLELRNYLALNQSKLDGQNAYNDESVAIEQARLKAIYDEQQKALQIQFEAGRISEAEFKTLKLESDVEYQNQKNDLQKAYDDQVKEQKLAEYKYQFDLDQEMLSQTMFGEFEAKFRGLEEQKMLETDFANKTILTAEGREKAIAKINEKYAKADKEIKRAKFQAEMSLAGDFAKNIAQIAGENTKVGKAASVAATTISTIQGSVAAFTGMTTAIPGPVGIGLGLAAAAAALASGYKSVEQILKVNSGLPGDGSPSVGGQGATPPAISATAPQLPQSVNPSLGQGIISRQVDSNGSATMKMAFSEALSENPLQPTLVTNDVTINQNAQMQQSQTQNI